MEELLESLIDKATDPEKSKEGVDYVTPVCDRINLDLDGPQVGIRYMATKVKSAKEEEAILGLNLIEACVQNCGQRFHNEVGKYRFLNELIKLISSKYDGDWTPEPVKKRIIEIMYSWTIGLPKETKIAEAYKMLKQQGIVSKDPEDPYSKPEEPEPATEKRKDTIFEDEEKSKLLSRLLKSSHPEDLQAANRLIKTMVRQDEIKIERQVKRNTEIETCCNNIKLLTEMLNHYSPSSPAQDKELMKELYDACDKMRPQLFRLASSATEDGDEGLAEILRVNDDLSRALEYYRKIFGLAPPTATGAASPPATPTAATDVSTGGASTLIDLGSANQTTGSAEDVPVSSVLENELKALGLHDIETPPVTSNSQIPMQGTQQPGSVGTWGSPAQNFGMLPPNMSSTVGVVRPLGQYQAPGMVQAGYMATGQMVRMPFQPMGFGAMAMPQRPGPVSMGTSSLTMTSPVSGGHGNLPNRKGDDKTQPRNPLDLLGQEVMQTQKQQQKQKQTVAPLQEKAAPEQQQAAVPTTDSLLSLELEPSQATHPITSANLSSTSPASFTPLAPPPKPAASVSLENVFVPLDTIKPGSHPPLTVLDKNAIRVIFHFAKTSAELNRNDLLIVVISTMSSLPSAVNSFVFQAAVPKTMKVKLQPPSGSELPAYNPILPPSAITQVMLIANPAKEKVRLKYKVSYQVAGVATTETGEVDSFPNAQE